jgi:phosphatidylglycerol:prolipoprotein diacylglycerol transferase
MGFLPTFSSAAFDSQLTSWDRLAENLTPQRLAYVSAMLLSLAVFLVVRHFQPKPAAMTALPWQQRTALTWAALVGGAFGAKIGYALATGNNWLQAGTWLTDGKTVTTGLLGAYLAVEVVKCLLHIHVKTGDGYALPLALALAVGRWGCFFNGCCHGLPTDLPWGVDFGDGVLRHPTQIYESLFHLTMAGLLMLFIRNDFLRNQRLKFYLIAYGCYRFLTEFIRPEPDWALGLTFYQWVSMVMVAGLSVQWWFDRAIRPQTSPVEAVAIP